MHAHSCFPNLFIETFILFFFLCIQFKYDAKHGNLRTLFISKISYSFQMSSSKIITLSGWDISQINNDMSMNDIMY